MKKMVFLGASVALLLFTGCSQKTPEINMAKNNNTQQKIQNADSGISKINSMKQGESESSVNGVNNVNNNGNNISNKITVLDQKAKTIHFDFDKYNIRSDQKPLVIEDSKLIKSNSSKGFSVKLEGNTDEWGSNEYNYALGLRRAKSVKNALVALGVKSNRLTLISYGESNPVCTEHNKACWAKNRRVDFKFLP